MKRLAQVQIRSKRVCSHLCDRGNFGGLHCSTAVERDGGRLLFHWIRSSSLEEGKMQMKGREGNEVVSTFRWVWEELEAELLPAHHRHYHGCTHTEAPSTTACDALPIHRRHPHV